MSRTILREQFFSGPMLDSNVSLAGKTVIVTGSNQGLGFSCATQLAALSPALLILAVRDVSKGETAAEEIRSKIAGKGKVEAWKLDLSSFDSVRDFAGRCEELERIDVVVENAGINTAKWMQTDDGWESSLQTNVLSTGLLAVLLLPLLKKTADRFPSSDFKPHLTIVSSELYEVAGYKERKQPGKVLDALNDKKHWSAMDRYPTTKLLDFFIARKIAALPSAKGVVVNSVNPGYCVSNLGREMPSILVWVMHKLARTTDEGAKNLTWAAVHDTPSGAYVSCCEPKPTSPWSTSAEAFEEEKRVWNELVEVWVKLSPEVESTLA